MIIQAWIRFQGYCGWLSGVLCVLISVGAFAKEIKTNEIVMPNAPDWLKQTRVEQVTNRIQHKLEWSTRRVHAIWYTSQEEFEKVHTLGPFAAAVAKVGAQGSSIHLGPGVDQENFDAVFGHELVHIVIGQKYKDAIPKWLEEGLANHLANRGKVDYAWLAKQPFPDDVRDLAHPFRGSAAGISYRYKASQALAEMLSKRCELENLIRLSVQRKMENYIQTYCGIADLNKAFREWVQKKK
ncbi:MAG: hypothetical protein NDI61_05415 [Bdellovibrionaceae bacterium]|nr:hypothetical protein [Pseudobdellovibrionaceae bacterium]